MKAVIEQAALVRAMGEAARVVRARNTIPILSNIKIEAEGDMLRLTATDLDNQITLPVSARVDEAGATTAPAHRLAGIIASLPEGCQISLSSTPDKLQVVAGRSRFSLPVLPVDDFPMIKPKEGGEAFTLDATQVRATFGAVRPVISTEEVRYYLNGVCLEVASERAYHPEPGLFVTATDGHRALRAALPPPVGVALDHRPIVPLRAVELLVRLTELAEQAEFQIGARMMVARFGAVEVVSKLIEGTFPDADRVMRRNSANVVVFSAPQLLAAVKRVAQVSAEKTRGVKFSFGADLLTVSCLSSEYGEAQEEVPCANAPTGFEIGANSTYLVSMLGAYAEDVELGFDGPAGPIMIRTPGDGKALLGTLMPLRV